MTQPTDIHGLRDRLMPISPRQLERYEQVARLRAAGLTYGQIAGRMQLSTSRVAQMGRSLVRARERAAYWLPQEVLRTARAAEGSQ